jgi:hypothetical protein
MKAYLCRQEVSRGCPDIARPGRYTTLARQARQKTFAALILIKCTFSRQYNIDESMFRDTKNGPPSGTLAPSSSKRNQQWIVPAATSFI